jgi:putative lipoprotein
MLIVLLLAGCAHAGPTPAFHDTQFGKVTGTVSYRERIAIDPAWTVTVELSDVTRADAPAVPLSTQNLKDVDGVPVPFELLYDPASIDSTHEYAVSARITHDGRLLWTSDARHAVLTRGASSYVEILVRRITP